MGKLREEAGWELEKSVLIPPGPAPQGKGGAGSLQREALTEQGADPGLPGASGGARLSLLARVSRNVFKTWVKWNGYCFQNGKMQMKSNNRAENDQPLLQ